MSSLPSPQALLSFAGVCLTLVLTPGPNMAYLVSRSICQGRRAGYVSLAGVGLAFALYIFCTALGLTALLMALPFAFDALRLAGAGYLFWLAWQALRPGGASPFEVRDLPMDSDGRLFWMGFLTNLLNPKAAMLYLSLLPQFMSPQRGSVLVQGLVLGGVQILISLNFNALFITVAGSAAALLTSRPGFIKVQRGLMGSVLGGLGLRMLVASRA